MEKVRWKRVEHDPVGRLYALKYSGFTLCIYLDSQWEHFELFGLIILGLS